MEVDWIRYTENSMHGRKIISVGMFFLIGVVFVVFCVSKAYAQESGIPGNEVFNNGYSYGSKITLKQGETKTVSIPIEVPSGHTQDEFFSALRVRKTSGPDWVRANGIIGGSLQIIVGPHTFGGSISGDQQYSAGFTLESEHGSSGASIALSILVLEEVEFNCGDADTWVSSSYSVDISGCFNGCSGCNIEVKEKPDWLGSKYGGTVLQGTSQDEDVGGHTVKLEVKKDGEKKGEGNFTITVKKAKCGDEYKNNPCVEGEEVAGSHNACSETNTKKTWQCASSANSSIGLVRCSSDCSEDGKCGTLQRSPVGTVIQSSLCLAGNPRNLLNTPTTMLGCFCRQNGGTYSTGKTWHCAGKNDGNDSETCTEAEYCSTGSGFSGRCVSCNSCVCVTPNNFDHSASQYQCVGHNGEVATCQIQNCKGGDLDNSVVIKINTETDPEGVNIYTIGNRARSITFRATDNQARTTWRWGKMYKNQNCGSDIYAWDKLQNIYKEDSPITLDAEVDNSYTVCFASRKDDDIDYASVLYRAVIDTTTYNRNIRFSVAGVPSAPSVTISGNAEPGATVEIVSVKSNKIGIGLGQGTVVTADGAGAWSVVINNAVIPDGKTNLEVITKTNDGVNEIEQTHTATIPTKHQGDIDAKTETTTSKSGSSQEPPKIPPPVPPPRDIVNPPTTSPPPFTISAKKPRITEGEEIKWTVTRKSNTEGFTVSCEERGEWGASPRLKRSSITNNNGTKSFTMKTTDDDIPEPSGSITCSVSSSSNPAATISRYSVQVISDDHVEKSNLIIDCTFGVEEDEAGNPKEQCSIKHLFQLANNVMKLLLWLAITGAGILIFYRGAQLAINVFTKGGHQEARSKVQSALKAILIGLIFILGAYLLVKAGFDIIGYNLNGGDPFKWDESSLPTPDTSEPARPRTPDTGGGSDNTTQQGDTLPTETLSSDQGQTETAQCVAGKAGTTILTKECTCTNCAIPVGITFKNNNKVHKELATKLTNLKNKTANLNWAVTEAWPTTSGHSGECHYVGTCVDIDFSGNYNDENVETFISQAKGSGLLAVYETKDLTTATRLKARSGILDKNVLQWDTITGDHFSVYDCGLSAPPRVCSL